MPPTHDEIQAHIAETQHGGGAQYTSAMGRIHPSDADTTVSTRSELQSALNSSADVIAIDSNIYMGSYEMDLGSKTLVGDRGLNGSEGPLLYTDVEGYTSGGVGSGRPYAMFYTYASSGNPRLSGLRLRGARTDSDWTRRSDSEVLSAGVTARSSALEVDNCDIWGFAWSSIMLRGYSPSNRVTQGNIHHNKIRRSFQGGYGYGVNMWYGSADISYTYFNNQRRSVTGHGYYFIDIDVNECIFGPRHYSHTFDMHCLEENTSNTSGDSPSATDYGLRAGGDMTVRNSTFCFDSNSSGGNINTVNIRGVPWTAFTAHHNRYTHSQRPPYNSGNSNPGYAWRQSNVHGVSGQYNSYSRVVSDGEYTSEWNTYDNQFDADNTAWSQNYGASVNLQGETPAPRADLAVNVRDVDDIPIDGANVEVRRLN